MIGGGSVGVALQVEREHQVVQAAGEYRRCSVRADGGRGIEVESEAAVACRRGVGIGIGRGGAEGLLVPAGVDGIGRAGSITLKVFDIGQRIHRDAEGALARHAGIRDLAAAVGADVEVVLRVAAEARHNIDSVGKILDNAAFAAGDKAMRAIFQHPARRRRSAAVGMPDEGYRVVADGGGCHRLGAEAGGYGAESDVVYIYIVITISGRAHKGRYRSIEHHIAAIAGVVLEADLDAVDRTGRLVNKVDGVHPHDAALQTVGRIEVGERIGYTDIEQRGVVVGDRAVALHHEFDHQVADIERLVELRHGGPTVHLGCGGRSGPVAIEVESPVAIDGSGGIGIGVGGGAAGAFGPAGTDAIGGAGAVGFEVLEVGQIVLRQQVARGGDRGAGEGGGVAAAQGVDIHVVAGAHLQVGEGDIVSRHRGLDTIAQLEACGTVLHQILGGGKSLVGPTEAEAGGQRVGDHNVRRTGAIGHVVDRDIVKVEVRRAAVGREDGQIGAVAVVCAQGQLDVLPRRDVAHLTDKQRIESTEVVGIAHHANDVVAIVGRRLVGPEAEHHRRQIVLEEREGEVGPEGGRAVEVEAIGAAVLLRRGNVGIGGGIVGMATEAGVEGGRGTRAAGVLEAVDQRQRVAHDGGAGGMEGAAARTAGIARAAEGTHGHGVVRVGRQLVKRQRRTVGGIVHIHHAGGVGEGHLPHRGRTVLRPADGDHVVAGDGAKLRHLGAGGHQVHLDIVDIDIVGTAELRLDGYKLARAGVLVQGHLYLLPCAGVLHLADIHGVEGGDVGRIGHDADYIAAIAGRGLVGPEGELQRIERHRHRRQRHIAVGGGSIVEIECIGRAALLRGAGVGICGGVAGALGPAGVDGIGGSASGGIVEAILIRQRRDGAARGVEVHTGRETGVARATDGAHAERVAGAGREIREGDRGGAGRGPGTVVHTVFPLALAAASRPAEGGAAGRDVADRKGGGSRTGELLYLQIVDRSRRLVVHRTVVAPKKDELHIACLRYIEGMLLAVPNGAAHVHLAAQVNPSRGGARSRDPARQRARRQHGGLRHQEAAQIVVRALAGAPPVEGYGIQTCRAEVHRAHSKHHAERAAVVVRRARGIVGDVESLAATIVGSRPDKPLVVLRAVDNLPVGVIVSRLEPSAVRQRRRCTLGMRRPGDQHGRQEHQN